jgi:hypothetical protein
MDRHFEPVTSIFDDTQVFTKYRVGVTFTELVVGGIPQKPEIIESWLRGKVLGGDQELVNMLRKTLDDLDIPEDASREELIEASNKIAATRNGNTFRRNTQGLALAAYNVKAMLKESTAILYPGGNGAGTHKWGATRKSPKSLLAERVFVDDYLIPLGRSEPDGTLMQVGHVNGPSGPRSTLTYYDYAIQPDIEFTISSSEDIITKDQWERILVNGERLGMGAIRSMGHGTFKVTRFDKV